MINKFRFFGILVSWIIIFLILLLVSPARTLDLLLIYHGGSYAIYYQLMFLYFALSTASAYYLSYEKTK